MILRSSNLIRFEYHLSGLQTFISPEDYNVYKTVILRKFENESKESIYFRLILNKLYSQNLKEYIDKAFKCLPILVFIITYLRKITTKTTKSKKLFAIGSTRALT